MASAIPESRIGKVVSDKMTKTVVVAVETRAHHRVYAKLVRRSKKYKVHDEGGQCRVGDLVRIALTRPLSKEKRWRVMEVISRTGEAAAVPIVEVEEEIAAKAGDKE